MTILQVIASSHLEFLEQKDIIQLIDNFPYIAMIDFNQFLILNDLLMPLLVSYVKFEKDPNFYEGYFNLCVDLLTAYSDKLE